MKRAHRLVLLTSLAALTAPALPAQEPARVAVTRVMVLDAAAHGKLCVGRRNTLRAELRVTGAPAHPLLVRLHLVIPGGAPAGTLVAEGSLPPREGSASFTFVGVEVPERLRGRGARLVVRAAEEGRDDPAPSPDATLLHDSATDWSC